MNEELSIADAMVREHSTIRTALDQFKIALEKKNERTPEFFLDLKWKIEQHFFMEEKAIFYDLKHLGGEFFLHVQRLLTEHELVLSILKIFENEVELKRPVNLTPLEEQLQKHEAFEDRFFYIELDKQLNIQQKIY